MSQITHRIGEWTYKPDTEPAGGSIAILILADGQQHTWIALDTILLEPIAQGKHHHTRHDALTEAIEQVPNWNIIRTL